MATRAVTENDFREPRFRDAKPEDYEFRPDGDLVRKDRWETGIRDIASAMGYEAREGFEIEHLVCSVKLLVNDAKAAGVTVYAVDELPD